LRIRLIDWDEVGAEDRGRGLRGAGHDVFVFSDRCANPRGLEEDPPDLFVIDLARAPSQGREIAGWLRRRKATRHVPILFIEGDAEKTDRVRAFLPDASFCAGEDLLEAIGLAVSAAPDDPLVPGAMDAYAGAPLPKKLGIAAGTRVTAIGAPDGFEEAVGPLPDGTVWVRERASTADVVVWFVPTSARLEAGFEGAAARVADGGRLWLAWPRKASETESDLSQAVVRVFGLDRGWVDYKISSIDATWSALCFARRSRNRR